MSKSEILHKLYDQCQEIQFDDSQEILMNAKSSEEAEFFQFVMDFILQQKQKKVIAEKRF